MTIIWCMVPEIWSVTDTTFCHFRPFLALIPLPPPNNPKNQNFEKMEKTPGDIIILYMCVINNKHVMYGSWDMKRDGHNFLSFWTVFCNFNPLTTQKIKILKNWKNRLKISSFYTSVPKIMITKYCFLDMARNGCNCYFSFWAIFCPFTHLTTQKIKILKNMKKAPGDIIILHICAKNYDQMIYGSWDMVHDGRKTDGKSDIWRWVPHLKISIVINITINHKFYT